MEKKSLLESLLGGVPIGETFEYKGVTYKVVENNDRGPKFCEGCAFGPPKEECLYLYCVSDERTDGKDVKFVKVK